jgi:DNA-binding XRE family transcriptional regulator
MRNNRIARFWDKVQMVRGVRKLAFPGCWEWCGSRFREGYGRIYVGGRRIGAHRYIWEQEHGPIPSGLSVLHRCDNPRCVRPDHLFLGTPLDNAQDMARKGRARGNRSGEENNNARLRDVDVQAIRERWRATRKRWGLQTTLAKEFGVSQMTISLIVRSKSRLDPSCSSH